MTLKSGGTTANPTFKQIADFSSSGPRNGDNGSSRTSPPRALNLLSTLIGSGWNGTTFSGTSMAAPMTSGIAALVLSAHPGWSPLKVKAAIVNTADASSAKILDYDPLRSGSGVVAADRAVSTTGLVTTSQGTASLSFGYEPIDGNFRESKTIRIWNTSNHPVRYNLTASSSLVSFSPSSVNVGARDSREVKVTASLSKAAVAALPSADQFLTGAFGELSSMSGAITATPTTSGTGLYPLRVAYLLVPRGLSDVETTFVRLPNKPGPNLNAKLKLVQPRRPRRRRGHLRAGSPRPARRRRPRHGHPRHRRPVHPGRGPHGGPGSRGPRNPVRDQQLGPVLDRGTQRGRRGRRHRR